MNTTNPEQTGKTDKVYREELENRGNALNDTPAESDARDAAKIEKAHSGQSQKMDGIDPDEADDGSLAEEIRRETIEKK